MPNSIQASAASSPASAGWVSIQRPVGKTVTGICARFKMSNTSRSNPLLCLRVAQASKVSATTGSRVRTRAMAKRGSKLAGGALRGAELIGGAESVSGAASVGGGPASWAKNKTA